MTTPTTPVPTAAFLNLSTCLIRLFTFGSPKPSGTYPADSPDGVEYLYFEEGSPAPEIMKTHRHVAFVTDNLDEAAAWCDEVILGPFEDTPEQDVMFARKDDALIEFCCRK